MNDYHYLFLTDALNNLAKISKVIIYSLFL